MHLWVTCKVVGIAQYYHNSGIINLIQVAVSKKVNSSFSGLYSDLGTYLHICAMMSKSQRKGQRIRSRGPSRQDQDYYSHTNGLMSKQFYSCSYSIAHAIQGMGEIQHPSSVRMVKRIIFLAELGIE